MARFILTFLLLFFVGCASQQKQSFQVLEKPQLEYPVAARADSATGTVGLHLYVDKTGHVQTVHVTRSSGNAVLDSSAVRYAHSLVFEPTARNGQSDGSWITWSVKYALQPDPEYFDTQVYVFRVQRLKDLLQTSERKNKQTSLELYQQHQKFIEYALEHPKENLNDLVAAFLHDSVRSQWQSVWQEQSLPHVVLQDFLMLEVDPDVKKRAKKHCFELVWEEIDRVKNSDPRVLSLLYKYLTESFGSMLSPKQQEQIDAFFRLQA
jgi:TonB family protein